MPGRGPVVVPMTDRELFDAAGAMMGPNLTVPRSPPLLRALAELFGIEAASLAAWELPQVVQGAFEDLRDRLPWS
eukprot:11970351-Alexandrium_andersonii.AAC.1